MEQTAGQKAEVAKQSELEKRETLMELEHTMAELRTQEKDQAAQLKETQKQRETYEAEWKRVRKEVSQDVANSNQSRREEGPSQNKTPSPSAQKENGQGEVSKNFNQKANETDQSVPQKQQQEQTKVESQQVKNSKPQPVLKPSFGGGVDRQAHLNAKTIDHQRVLAANKQDASLDGIAARLNDKASEQQQGTDKGKEQQPSDGIER